MENLTKEKANNLLISKSSYLTGFRCRYGTYLNVLNRDAAKKIENEMILINGKEFGKKAAKFLGVSYEVSTSCDKKKMAEDTKKAIELGHKSIAEATFIYDKTVCSVDVFKVNDDRTISFYEVKSGSSIKETNKFDIAFQYVVLKSIGYNIKNVYLVYANELYSFKKGEQIDFSKLFKIEDCTDICIELEDVVREDIKSISDSINNRIPPIHDFSSNCNADNKCPFMDFCIKEAGIEKEKSIFNIAGPRFTDTKINKWYLNGIKTYEDIINNLEVNYKKNGEYKDANWKYVAQANSYLKKEDSEINMKKLGEFLDKISYPLASFDYEGFATAVPMYYGLRPSQQIVFQFSYDYVEYEGAKIEHFEFLADPSEDPRKSVCKALEKLPKANSILVWNKTYEALRNTEMSELEGFEKFKDNLLYQVEHFVDLMVPFRERVIAPWQANGSYSLKPITESFIPNLKYHDMIVHNGIEAAEKFLELTKMKGLEKEKYIHALKMYNNQDTYAPLKILEKMIRIYRNDKEFYLFTDKNHEDVTGKNLHIGDTVTCNLGLGVITKFTDKYVYIMVMNSFCEVKRKGKNLVLIQEFMKDKPRNIKVSDKLVYEDMVTCNRGIGKVSGFTKCFVRISLLSGQEIIRKQKNLNKIQDFI